MEKRLKSWQGWLLFGGSMVVVFVLGLCVSALMERRAELASVFNNRKTVKELRHATKSSRVTFHVSIRRGLKPPRPTSRVNSMEMWLWMYWNSVPKW